MIELFTCNRASRLIILRVSSGILLLSSSYAATFTWNGAAGDNNWSTSGNWVGGSAPANDGTAVIVLAGTNGLAPNVATPWDISSLTFSNNAGAFVLGGSALTIRAGGIVSSNANIQMVNNAITLGAAQTWSAASGNLVFGGTINNGGNLLTVSGGFNTLISGIVSGAGGMTKTGTGTNTLSAANTFSGVTTVSAGVMNIQNSGALGSTSAGTVVASGAVLQLQGGISVGNEPLTISGTGGLNSGALRNISGDNSWGGVITLGAASTIGCDANSLTLSSGGIVNSTFLTTFTNAGNISVTGTIGSGTGGVTKTGAGTLTLSGTNSYGGLTTVSAGNQVTIGYSSGSKVWSNATLRVPEIINWCKGIAAKLTRKEKVVTGTTLDFLDVGESLVELPDNVIAVTWSDDVYKHSVEVNSPAVSPFQLHDAAVEIIDCAQGKLRARLNHSSFALILQMQVENSRIVLGSETDLSQTTVTRKGETFALLTYLKENHFHIYLSDFSRISGAALFRSNAGSDTAFSDDCIRTDDWKAQHVDITKEFAARGSSGTDNSIHVGIMSQGMSRQGFVFDFALTAISSCIV